MDKHRTELNTLLETTIESEKAVGIISYAAKTYIALSKAVTTQEIEEILDTGLDILCDVGCPPDLYKLVNKTTHLLNDLRREQRGGYCASCNSYH